MLTIDDSDVRRTHDVVIGMELSALPTELIHTISGHLDLRDHLLLCRTNSRMHAVCVEWIYRVLDFKTSVQLLRCCKTILCRPEAAILVWQMKIHCFPSYALKSFYNTFRSATTRMENLQVISISSPALFHSISDVAFPRLIACVIPLLWDSHCYSFLRRNHTIESAVVVAPVQGNGSLSKLLSDFSNIQPIRMPKLQHFDGPEIAACTVVPGAPVSRLTIWWGRKPAMEFSRGLAAAAASEVELRELTNVIRFWDPTLLRGIVKHTPRIQVLIIRSSTFTGLTPEKENFLSALDDILPSLTCLTNLIVLDGTPFHLDRIGEALESEFDRVRQWGAICPTLTHICVSNGWLRTVNVWLPVKCFTSDPESGECLRWLIKKIAISPELPVGYEAVAHYFAGVDGMQALGDAVSCGEDIPAFQILRKEGGGGVIVFSSDP
ncbi:hypothetical protein C8R45DRAFT_1081081 [Mycena sanguinolenta]|nr:hypothetical protein C8R45DRAFT_1081081 [Mycena sanguinolenta]